MSSKWTLLPYDVPKQHQCTYDPLLNRFASVSKCCGRIITYNINIWENDVKVCEIEMPKPPSPPHRMAFVSDRHLFVVTQANVRFYNYKTQFCRDVDFDQYISFLLYNSTLDYLFIVTHDKLIWHGPFTDSYDFSAPVISPFPELPVAFSYDGLSAFCFRPFSQTVNQYDAQTGALLKTFPIFSKDHFQDCISYISNSPMYKIGHTSCGALAFALYNERRLCVTGLKTYMIETPFNGPDILGVTPDDRIVVREWGTAGRVYAVEWGWTLSARKYFISACIK